MTGSEYDYLGHPSKKMIEITRGTSPFARKFLQKINGKLECIQDKTKVWKNDTFIMDEIFTVQQKGIDYKYSIEYNFTCKWKECLI